MRLRTNSLPHPIEAENSSSAIEKASILQRISEEHRQSESVTFPIKLAEQPAEDSNTPDSANFLRRSN